MVFLCIYIILQVNTFQLVLATNTRQSYVMFLYQNIIWIYGRASGGRHARAGLNAGDGRRQITVPYSGSSAISSIERRSNVRVRGLYIYRTTGFRVLATRKWILFWPQYMIIQYTSCKLATSQVNAVVIYIVFSAVCAASTPVRPPVPPRLSNFFPFTRLSVLPRGDDNYRATRVRQSIKMYGRSYRTVYVSSVS